MSTPAAASSPLGPAAPAGEAQSRSRRMAGHIREAAEATGVPFDFLLAQASQESRLDPEAKNRRSSASGLFQFTSGTWLETVKKHGAKHGMKEMSEAITRGANGKYQVADPEMRARILDMRKDPKASALMAAEYAKGNAKVLEARLGRAASAQDLYLAHFLGASGAARVLEGKEDSPDTVAAALVPGAARANPDVFHERGSRRARSVEDFHEVMGARFDTALSRVAGLARRSKPEIDLARLMPPARPQVEIEAQLAELPPAAEPEILPAAAVTADGPASPFFPVALPPAGHAARLDDRTLRGLIDAMDGKV